MALRPFFDVSAHSTRYRCALRVRYCIVTMDFSTLLMFVSRLQCVAFIMTNRTCLFYDLHFFLRFLLKKIMRQPKRIPTANPRYRRWWLLIIHYSSLFLHLVCLQQVPTLHHFQLEFQLLIRTYKKARFNYVQFYRHNKSTHDSPNGFENAKVINLSCQTCCGANGGIAHLVLNDKRWHVLKIFHMAVM